MRTEYFNKKQLRIFAVVFHVLVFYFHIAKSVATRIAENNTFFVHYQNAYKMAQDNRISASITAADKTIISDHITSIKTKLVAVLLFNLSADERQSLPKMGDKSLSFTGKAFEYAKQNTALVPSFLDIIEADKDYVLANDLFKIHQELLTLTVSIEDAIMVSGSEAYDAAKIFYAAVKGAASSNVAGANAIADDLKSRYPGKSGSTVKSSTDAPK